MARRPRRQPPREVHIQNPNYSVRAMCGALWVPPIRGGRVASDTDPPVVVDEAGSVNAATCKTCLGMWRLMIAVKLS